METPWCLDPEGLAGKRGKREKDCQAEGNSRCFKGTEVGERWKGSKRGSDLGPGRKR